MSDMLEETAVPNIVLLLIDKEAARISYVSCRRGHRMIFLQARTAMIFSRKERSCCHEINLHVCSSSRIGIYTEG